MTLKNKWIIRYFTIMKGALAVIFLCCIIYGEACCKKPDDPMDDDDPEEQKESQEPGLIPLMQIQEEGNEIQEQERMPAEEKNEVQEADYVSLMEASEESESLEHDLMQSMDGMQLIRRKIGCKQLKRIEKKIFKICRHSRRGFTWKQALRCEKRFRNRKIPVAMPTKADFLKSDRNRDGVMTWREWKQFSGCS